MCSTVRRVNLVDEYVGQHLGHLNRESDKNAMKLVHVQETVQSAVEEITNFLSEQVDFDAIHQEAMLKSTQGRTEGETERTSACINSLFL
jgi:hypothetical protein